MEIIKIARGYKQTTEVELPGGKKAFLSHEAHIEAKVNEDDVQDLPACYDELEQIVKAEVASSIVEQKKQIAAAVEVSGGTKSEGRPRLG